METTVQDIQEQTTFKILAGRLDEAKARFAKLAKKAARCGCETPSFKVLRVFEEKKIRTHEITGKQITVVTEWAEVEVTGPAVKVNGWMFAATVEHTEAGNAIRKTPAAEGIEIPIEFRTSERRCDHCGHKRNRIDTFLVTDGAGNWKQIGRNCLGEFLGKDPKSIVWGLDFWGSVRGFADEDEGFGGGRMEESYSYEGFMEVVFHFVRKYGWTSRKAAREAIEGKEATADKALWLLSPSYSDKEREHKRDEWATVLPIDGEKGKAAIDWALATFPAKPVAQRNEYEQNLAIALQKGHVGGKDAGLVASVAVCYSRHLEEELKRSEFAKKNPGTSEHVGKAGERLELRLRIEKIRSLEGQYGATQLHIFSDEAGRSFKWFGSKFLDSYEGNNRVEANVGDWIVAKWTVKGHDEFKGVKQTQIFRPSVLKIEKSE